MLTVTGDCRYTLTGLSHLLGHLMPVVLTSHEWFAAQEVPSQPLLVVSTGKEALADLLTVFRRAKQAGVSRTALLGTRGQMVFLNSCGYAPSRTLLLSQQPGVLRQQTTDWVLRHRRRQMNILNPRDMLTVRERRVLLAGLSGVTPLQASAELGISIKTFYTHRHNALGKLEMRSVRDLLRAPVEGGPDTAALYRILLQ